MIKLFKDIIKLSLTKVFKIIFLLVGFLPVRKKLIVFESYLGKQYSCNPRSIYEYLKEYHPEYRMVWSVDKRYTRIFEELNIPYIKRLSIKWLVMMPRARYWVTNSRMPMWIKKPGHTIYLQTWHGTPLKKLALDMVEVHMPGTTIDEYKKNFLKEAQKWDYLISPNTYSTEIFKRAFGFEKQMLETGYPRNDFLINNNKSDVKKKIKERLGIPNDKKVLLYAPTWRDNQYHERGRYKFEQKLDFKKLQKSIGNDSIILLRMHYLVSGNLDLTSMDGFVYDVSNYDDLRELYLVSDILITDYSSVMFDFSCLNRPIIFYTYDLEHYRDELRGFYFDFEKDAPGPLVKTTEELIAFIKRVSTDSYLPPETYSKFRKKFVSLEKGEATQRVVKEVFEK